MSDNQKSLNSNEGIRLQKVAQSSLYATGLCPVTAMAYCFKVLRRYIKPGNLLELGPAEGIMTGHITSLGIPVTAVDGSALFCEGLSQRFPQVKVVHSLFEKFEPGEQFDNIVLGHVLEHVQDPIDILLRVRNWLKPGGMVFAAVPNARSLHRQGAVIMGLLPCEDAMNDMDRHHGHRRVFNPESFRAAFTQSGFQIDLFGGYWIKPLSNGQIDRDWTPAMLQAFMQLGERYPDIAAEIYVVASNPISD